MEERLNFFYYDDEEEEQKPQEQKPVEPAPAQKQPEQPTVTAPAQPQAHSDEFPDYFNNNDIAPEVKPEPVETAEDREAREIEDITTDRRRRTKRNVIIGVIVVVVLLLLAWLFTFLFVPYVSVAQRTGRVMDVRYEGWVKTYEGEMISEEYITDTITVFKTDFLFSIESDSIARQLLATKARGHRITVDYKRYHCALPWRGKQKDVVTGFRIDD